MPKQLAKFIQMLRAGDGVNNLADRISRKYKLLGASVDYLVSESAPIGALQATPLKRTKNAETAPEAT